ncbi:MAG TPA: cyclic pyranopterin monophosphate synthase MoaC [Gemmatimonadaceae bacterium]|nr:cyclic pyranopterin monophosphate synthase MoaC [Gemmatimonadaceae bacterium]
MSSNRRKRGPLTHVGADGAARMVDVSAKPETDRMARATGTIRMEPETLAAIRANTLAKGDVIAVARVAGVMAAKRTAELIPLCHPLPLTDVQVEIEVDEALPGLRATATTRTFGRTGVEMEAISAVCVTLITVYDMAKAIDKSMLISDVCLLEKAGGRSGTWRRE